MIPSAFFQFFSILDNMHIFVEMYKVSIWRKYYIVLFFGWGETESLGTMAANGSVIPTSDDR
jgi:hypothetical protein